MAYPFTTIVQHHEGAGAPSDNVMRFAGGGYSYGIGVNAWTRFREPSQDYSTADYNHRVVGVCLSGDRNVYSVTDRDIQMMAEIGQDAKKRGWVIQTPTVKPHREMGGSNKTICPGNKCAPPWNGYPGDASTWTKIIRAYQGTGPTPVPPSPGDDVPADKDFVDALTTADGSWKLQYDGGIQTITGSFYGSYFTLPANVRNDPNRRFLTIFPNFGKPGYAIMGTKGEVYNFTTKQ